MRHGIVETSPPGEGERDPIRPDGTGWDTGRGIPRGAVSILRDARRLWNALGAEIGWRGKRPISPARPTTIVVDPTTACNLRCPLCPTGAGMPGRPRGRMRLDDWERLVDLVAPTSLRVLFGNWGEPLLHPQIAQMIARAASRGLRTHLVTNLTALDEPLAHRLVASGLGQAIVSLDGASEATYARYRVGGGFETVRSNLALLKRVRDESGSARPRITWQFLVFRHNEHEVDEARAVAAGMGIEIAFRGASLGGPGETPPVRRDPHLARRWLSDNPRWRRENDYFSDAPSFHASACWWLWKVLAVSWDGSAAPCCCTFEAEHDVGNVLREGLDAVWNGPAMAARRALFGRSRPGKAPAASGSICDRCLLYAKPDGGSRAEWTRSRRPSGNPSRSGD